MASDLDQNELDAIREAVSSGAPSAAAAEGDAQPLALIEEDRAAVEARPAGAHLGTRWAGRIARQLRHVAAVDCKVAGAETVEGEAALESLGRAWITTAAVAGRRGRAILAIGGGMVDVLAARLLGAKEVEGDNGDHEPSRSSLRVFGPIGRAITEALAQVWHEDQRVLASFDDSDDTLEAVRLDLADADVVIKVTITIEGAGTGRVVLLARPTMLIPTPREMTAVKAAPEVIAQALGAVPLAIRVELGRAMLPMSQLQNLEVGQVLPLTGFVDDPLPIECAGVIKAWGRPVVYRGVLGVEVCPPPSDHHRSTENDHE